MCLKLWVCTKLKTRYFKDDYYCIGVHINYFLVPKSLIMSIVLENYT